MPGTKAASKISLEEFRKKIKDATPDSPIYRSGMTMTSVRTLPKPRKASQPDTAGPKNPSRKP